MKPITLFTWGYYGWGNHTPEFVKAVDAVESSRGFQPPIFVDIRIRRSVRAAGFTGSAFERLIGQDRHLWTKSLGNKFIVTRTGPQIQIADPAAAVELLDIALESARHNQRLLFFCSCQWPKAVRLAGEVGGQGGAIAFRAEKLFERLIQNRQVWSHTKRYTMTMDDHTTRQSCAELYLGIVH